MNNVNENTELLADPQPIPGSDAGKNSYSNVEKDSYSDAGKNSYSNVGKDTHLDAGKNTQSDVGKNPHSNVGKNPHSDAGKNTHSDVGGDLVLDRTDPLPEYDDGPGRAALRDLIANEKLEMVLFDLDGTLIHSGVPFTPYRDRLGMTGDVIGGIGNLSANEQQEKWAIIMEYERELEAHARPAPGAHDLIMYLRDQGIRTGVITRSTGEYAKRQIEKWDLAVDYSIGREDTVPKPDPKGLFHLLDTFGILPERSIMVGDFIWDVLAARNAGILSVLVVMEHSKPYIREADIVVRSLQELLDLVAGR